MTSPPSGNFTRDAAKRIISGIRKIEKISAVVPNDLGIDPLTAGTIRVGQLTNEALAYQKVARVYWQIPDPASFTAIPTDANFTTLTVAWIADPSGGYGYAIANPGDVPSGMQIPQGSYVTVMRSGNWWCVLTSPCAEASS